MNIAAIKTQTFEIKIMKSFYKSLSLLVAVAFFTVGALAQGSYKQPPKAVMDVLNAPAPTTTSVSPARDKILLAQPLRYPPIS